MFQMCSCFANRRNRVTPLNQLEKCGQITGVLKQQHTLFLVKKKRKMILWATQSSKPILTIKTRKLINHYSI